ncbi:unnamed protein product [Camellia sinensis]
MPEPFTSTGCCLFLTGCRSLSLSRSDSLNLVFFLLHVFLNLSITILSNSIEGTLSLSSFFFCFFLFSGLNLHLGFRSSSRYSFSEVFLSVSIFLHFFLFCDLNLRLGFGSTDDPLQFLGFSISITSPMGELKIEEVSLPALFDQARKIHLSASESGIDQG